MQPVFLGVVQTLHNSMLQVEGLALDWMGNNIYWVDAQAKKIEVSRKDGKYRKILYTETLDKPRALVLDPMRGYVHCKTLQMICTICYCGYCEN